MGFLRLGVFWGCLSWNLRFIVGISGIIALHHKPTSQKELNQNLGHGFLWFRVFDVFDEGVGMLKRFLFAALYSF